MPQEIEMMTCRTHGVRPVALICRHLKTGRGLGFYPAADDPDDASLQAWCFECEQQLQKQGGWPETEETYKNFFHVCDRCYLRSESMNRLRIIHSEFASQP
jgi:hypothetical protein